MRATRQVQMTGALGLCLLSVPMMKLARTRPAPPPLAYSFRPPVRHSPADRALWRARRWRLRAMHVVDEEREAMEAWDPAATDQMNEELLRRRLMARDRGGYLRQARAAAQQAAALARTPDQAYRTAALRTIIECDAGDHAAELEQARLMMALAPRDSLSLICLHRAAQCNGLPSLARWADATRQALWDESPPPLVRCRAGER